MRCKRAHFLLSDAHHRELKAREQVALNQHLGQCSACRELAQAYEEMMEMLATAEPPPVPSGFEAQLHHRLATASAEDRAGAQEARFGWRRAFGGASLVMVGAACAAAILVLRPASVDTQAGICPEQLAATDNTTAATSAGAELPEGSLRLGEIAVLTLELEEAAYERDARLEIVLPDGLSFVGEDSEPLTEKVIAWNTTLAPNERTVRIPVIGQRPGTWVLIARAQLGDSVVLAETKLKVSQS